MRTGERRLSSKSLRIAALTGLGFVLLYGVMVGLGLLWTKVLNDDWPVKDEDAINRGFAQDRTRTWNDVSWFFSEVGNTLVIVALLAIVVVAFRRIFGRWNESLFVLLATAGQSLVFAATQFVVNRPRPHVPHLDHGIPTSSFPSGHTSASVALYGSVALVLLWRARRSWLPVTLAAVLLLLPWLVATSRLYRGMHHPTDVASSFVNGLTCIALSWRAFLAEKRGALVEAAKTVLPPFSSPEREKASARR